MRNIPIKIVFAAQRQNLKYKVRNIPELFHIARYF